MLDPVVCKKLTMTHGMQDMCEARMRRITADATTGSEDTKACAQLIGDINPHVGMPGAPSEQVS